VVVHAKTKQDEVRLLVEHLRLQSLQSLRRGIAARGAVDRGETGVGILVLQRIRPAPPENQLRLRGVTARRDAVPIGHELHRPAGLQLGLRGPKEFGLASLNRPDRPGHIGVIHEREVTAVAEARNFE